VSAVAAVFVVVAAACNTPPPPSPAATGPFADLLIVNGRVYSGDDQGTLAESVAVSGNAILRVGTGVELAALRGPDTRVVDARGGTVAAGFNDSHVHFLSGGLALNDVDLAGLTTLDAVQDKIRVFAAAKRDRPWIVGRGWLYAAFPGGTPTREQLDLVVPDRPAVMECYDGHSVWVNSRALTLAGITKATPDPANGIIVKDAKTGEPTGHLKEAAAELMNVVMPQPTPEERRAALRAAVAEAHRFGVTSIENAGTSLDEVALYEEVRKAGDLRVRTYLALSASEATTEADLDRMDAAWKRLGDDATLKTGAVKIFADGVIESRTAAMLAPYANAKTSGAPNLSPEALTKIATMADKRGWQIFIHAIGDRAIRISLDALERAAAANPAPSRGRRHRLEHIETIDQADIPRFGRLGIIASQQPVHVQLGDMNSTSPKGPWPDNLGPVRASRGWVWKSIQDAGGRLTFGSDWPVAPLEAGQGLWLVATRTGPPTAVPQKLSMRSALDGYTRWPAYASFEDQRKGRIAPGMLADLVILSSDLLAQTPAKASDIVVETTIFDGKVVYERTSVK
jgi:predicted amidohydrolase YtcJ